jgi:tetratricopeptide (TPR) repeat protein
LAIRDLERVTREVLQTDFPQETNALKAFFTGAAQEFTANLSGKTLMSQEAVIGAVIGSFIAPGIGSVIGGAIGGWLGGNKQQKALEQLIDKYQKARGKVFQEWESLMQVVYGKLSDLLYDITSIRLLTYQSLDQAIDFYNQGNKHLEENLEKAIEFYDKAIQANPGLVLAWNNKGYALNQLGQFEKAIPTLARAIQLDRTLVIALNNLGDSLQGLGRNEEAIATYNESLKLEPDNYSAWCGIGTGFYHLQQFEKTIEVADKLIHLNSEDSSYWWYVKAACQSLMGYTQPALESLKEAVKLNPGEIQKLAKTDPDLDSLREDEQFKALMESSVGVSYASLKEHLKQKQWREADQETARLIQEVTQKVANSTEVNQETLKVFPCTDLETIDLLWRENSEGKFGFSVQKRTLQESFKDRDIFGTKIGWRVKNADGNWIWYGNDNFNYMTETMPNGYLPSSLWAGKGLIRNHIDRLIALFARMDSCSIEKV